jgi:hypothetical protein
MVFTPGSFRHSPESVPYSTAPSALIIGAATLNEDFIGQHDASIQLTRHLINQTLI